MISTDEVKSLVERQPKPNSPVLSVYLNTDQSEAINIERAFQVVLKDMLREIKQKLNHDQMEVFKSDAERVRDYVEKYREPKKGLIIFADTSEDFFWTGELQVKVRNSARWNDVPCVRPLLELIDEYERYGVVLADRERARIFTVYLGEIEAHHELFAEADVSHIAGPGRDHPLSQMNIQRKADEHVHWHLKRVADEMSRLSSVQDFDRLILAGPIEVTRELSNLLPLRLRSRIVREISLPIDASDALVLEESLKVEQEVEREQETALVDDLIIAAGKHYKAVMHLGPTIQAIQEWRVWQLVYADGFTTSGSQCGNCGALYAVDDKDSCDYCGQPLNKVNDLVERADSRVMEMQGKVELVHGDAAARLQQEGSIGARLRW